MAEGRLRRQLGLDNHFYDRARAEGKKVQGLETVEYQVSRFDGMTMEQQERMLAETLKELDQETGQRLRARRRLEGRRRRGGRANRARRT